MQNLAALLRQTGRLEEALPILQKLVAHQQQLVGKMHPDLLVSTDLLADTYLHLGRDPEATDLFQQLLAMRIDVYGERHAETMVHFMIYPLSCIAVGNL